MLSVKILTPLRQRAMRRLWSGQLWALVAGEVHFVVIAWLALELTGSGLALGSVLVVGILPRAALTLFGGVAADRFGHRKVLVAANAARALLLVTLALIVHVGAVQLWHLYVVGLLLGAITAFYSPSLYTAVPREVPTEHVRAGNALMRGTAEATGAVGPVAAGFMVGAFGTGASIWITAVCFAVSALAMLSMRGTPLAGQVVTEPEEGAEHRSLLRDLRDGFASLREDPFLLRVLALLFAAGLALTGPITVGLPWLAREEFDVEPVAFGLLLSTWTVGSLVGVLVAGSLSKAPSWRLLVTLVSGVLVTALAVLGVARSLPAAAAAVLAMGVAAGAFNIFLLTWLQLRTHPARLGRLMSMAELAELTASPASYLLAGWMLDVSVFWMFTGAAVLMLTGAALVVIPGWREHGQMTVGDAESEGAGQAGQADQTDTKMAGEQQQ